MTSKTDTLSRFIDAAADRVARAIAAVKADATREKELRDAQFAARMAQLEARISAVSELERRLADRLATLKDGEPGRDGVDGQNGRDGLDGVAGTDGERGADGAPGKDGVDGADGRSVTIDDVTPVISAEIERVLSTWKRPQDGRSVTLDDVSPVIQEAVSAAVALIPPAKDGRDGTDGRDGNDGAPGRDGEPGKDGRDGVDGALGKMPIAREWSDTVHYAGDIRTFNGGTYQAIRDTGKAPSHEDWILLAGRGDDGRDGRSFTIRGTWQAGEEYRELDVAVLNGASFVARRDDPGPCPGDGWQLMAAQGKQGKPGERGASVKGDRGPAGEPVLHLEATEEGLLTLVNGDGSTASVDLYPLLAKLRQ